MRRPSFTAATLALAIGVAACASAPPIAGSTLAESLTGRTGDAERGRVLLAARETTCMLCHRIPGVNALAMGDIGPPLDGVGARLGAGEIRMRIVVPERINPDTPMPSYLRTEGLRRVAEPFRGKPLLSASEIEDIVAYLGTLK